MKTNKWPRIHNRRGVWIIDTRGVKHDAAGKRVKGDRIYRSFATAKEAEDFANDLRKQRQEQGAAAFSIPAALREQAIECATLLEPHGATIREACQWYEKHVLK